MSVFISKVSPVNGKLEWVCQDENYDYNQEIARSAYADMIHDTERNQKYELGLKAAIRSMRSAGRPCNVLDIGTGTGLLSMMAVRNGADTVHACDAFEPAAICAEKIIAANGMSGKITLIRKRSTELLVPDDMPIKANILITEVFDTELIGEGAIGTFTHALKHLLEPDCIVVPSFARMYIQPVQSAYLHSRNKLHINLPDRVPPLTMPSDMERYNNDLGAPLFDLQLCQLPTELFTTLAPPQLVFEFDFCGRKTLAEDEVSDKEFTVDTAGTCHAFFMWWDLDMDMTGEILLSCAPYWEHPVPRADMQWRDHWMQAIYYPSRPLTLQKGSQCILHSKHDEYSLCFDIIDKPNKDTSILSHNQSIASDILHCVYTRSRLAMLHDKDYISSYTEALSHNVGSDTIALCASESSFLPFLLARLGAKQVYVVESHFIGARKITQSLIDHNKLHDVIKLYTEYSEIPEESLNRVTLVAGEPYFSVSSLPWDDLQLWYIRSNLTQSHSVKVCPLRAHLYSLVVQFDDLHKIRSPLGTIEGLDLSIYDHMIEEARQKTDNQWEPHSLWEYPCKALSQPCKVMTFDLSQRVSTLQPEISSQGDITIESDGCYNGIVTWMVYDLDDTQQVSFGVKGKVVPGEYPKWNMERKQAVFLPLESTQMTAGVSKLRYDCNFTTESGALDLSFSVT